MISEWKMVKATDIIEFNPKLSIKKNAVATKISMDKLLPYTKRIPSTEKAIFSGGAKFCNGDTIMARITPCLENGKTAFVDSLEDDEVAFGSTEFIVMRAKEGLSDPHFVYYLATSPFFREIAIKSMVGSSGRQRVQQSVLESLELQVPSLEEQKTIALYLRMLDDKIAVNEQINDNLEQQLQALYQQMYGQAEQINGTLAELCCYAKAKIAVKELSCSNYFSTENMLPNKQGYSQAAGLPTTEQTPCCQPGNVLVSNIRPYFKKIVFCNSIGGCSADVLCFETKIPHGEAYLYCTLYADSFFDFMVAGSKGTKMPRGDKQQIMQYPVHVPNDEEVAAFEKMASPMLAMIDAHRQENSRLIQLRDTLLPQLMSGEIDVSSVQLGS